MLIPVYRYAKYTPSDYISLLFWVQLHSYMLLTNKSANILMNLLLEISVTCLICQALKSVCKVLLAPGRFTVHFSDHNFDNSDHNND